MKNTKKYSFVLIQFYLRVLGLKSLLAEDQVKANKYNKLLSITNNNICPLFVSFIKNKYLISSPKRIYVINNMKIFIKHEQTLFNSL